MSRILLIEDDQAVGISIKLSLEDHDYDVVWAKSAEEGLRIIDDDIDLILTDIWLPQKDGLQLIEELSKSSYFPPTIVMSGHGTIETAVKATKLGAYDFLEKPLSVEKLLVTVQNCLNQFQLQQALLQTDENYDGLIGNSDFTKSIQETIKKVAKSDIPILITGENGTGKNVLAHLIHRNSDRNKFPFVSVNCAAIPESLIESELFGHMKGAFTGATSSKKGKFELADHGTLFLDEIGDMDLNTQAKILKAIEEKEICRLSAEKNMKVDVRVIAATNRDLADLIKKGLFRDDLFYRLNVLPISVPPLRERKGDILVLAKHFLKETCLSENRIPMKFDDQVLDLFESYSWPGNIRELKNLIHRLCILTSTNKIGLENLPTEILKSKEHKPAIDHSQDFRSAKQSFEKSYLLQKLEENQFNISKTAQVVGLDRTALHRKIKSLSIDLNQDIDV